MQSPTPPSRVLCTVMLDPAEDVPVAALLAAGQDVEGLLPPVAEHRQLAVGHQLPPGVEGQGHPPPDVDRLPPLALPHQLHSHGTVGTKKKKKKLPRCTKWLNVHFVLTRLPCIWPTCASVWLLRVANVLINVRALVHQQLLEQ